MDAEFPCVICALWWLDLYKTHDIPNLHPTSISKKISTGMKGFEEC